MIGVRSERALALAFVLGAAAWLAAAPARAHPTEAEIARAREERRLCTEVPPAEAHLDPARLGMDEAALRALFGDALAEVAPEAAQPPAAASEGADAPDAPRRLRREASGDLAAVEYELWQGRVYRIRWRLAPRFERPALDALAERARACLGRPVLDQTFEAEPGSPKATYRRIVWRHDDRRIELRQLHPLRGGPVHLVVGSRPVLRAMGDAGVSPPPLPATTVPWWRRGAAPVVPVAPDEAEALGLAFLRLLAHADVSAASSEVPAEPHVGGHGP